jgi:hypothetical protein
MPVPTRYESQVVVQRDGEGGWMDDNGIWHPADPELIMDCPANVQAGGLLASSRRAEGPPQTDADGQFVVPPQFLGRLMALIPGDRVSITYPPIKDGTSTVSLGADAEVTFVRPEDRTALIKYL